jgi:hypothetical protein
MEVSMSDVLQEVFRILGSIAAPAITLAAVWLGWRLSASSQRAQRRLDRLNSRFSSLSQVMTVSDNVPPDLTGEQLVAKLENDEEFRDNLVHRLVRLFGLRNELIASLDRELVGFVDSRLRPLFVIRLGSYGLPPERVAEFGAAVSELRRLVQRVELKLLAEQDELTD